MIRRAVALAGLTVAVLVGARDALPEVAARASLPDRVPDAEFWRLVESSSEPNGYFRSNNLVSDEVIFGQVVPSLMRRPRTGGAYLGVGPEQNFGLIPSLAEAFQATAPRLIPIGLEVRTCRPGGPSR